MGRVKTIHTSASHFGWDNSLPPSHTVEPGATLVCDVGDSSGDQLSATSEAAALKSLDFTRVNPTTGPIWLDGAEPGDAVKVTIVGYEPLVDWGWTAIIPGFGLLADDFPEPALHIWRYGRDLSPVAFGSFAEIPLRPFAGTIGLALAEPGLHSVVPPRRVGGNMDVRDLSEGATLFLPVEVSGALFSIGDTHAAQGDGEVCGTAIETSMRATVQLGLVKHANLPAPRFETQAPATSHVDSKGYWVTTGIGPDLLLAARDAVRSMIDLLDERLGIPADSAYMLCSVAADIRIGEIVDLPNYVVGCYLPRQVVRG